MSGCLGARTNAAAALLALANLASRSTDAAAVLITHKSPIISSSGCRPGSCIAKIDAINPSPSFVSHALTRSASMSEEVET